MVSNHKACDDELTSCDVTSSVFICFTSLRSSLSDSLLLFFGLLVAFALRFFSGTTIPEQTEFISNIGIDRSITNTYGLGRTRTNKESVVLVHFKQSYSAAFIPVTGLMLAELSVSKKHRLNLKTAALNVYQLVLWPFLTGSPCTVRFVSQLQAQNNARRLM